MLQAATLLAAGCNPTCCRLQPYVLQAVLALATDLHDLRARLGRMIACFSRAGKK